MRRLLLIKDFKNLVPNTLITNKTIDICNCLTGEVIKHFEPHTESLFLEGIFIPESNKEQFTLQQVYTILKDYMSRDCYITIG